MPERATFCQICCSSARNANEEEQRLLNTSVRNIERRSAFRNVWYSIRSKWPEFLCKDLFPWIPARLVFSIAVFFGGFVFYVLRANMSMAIVAMVNATADQRSSGNSSSSCHPTAPLFGWNNEQQGMVCVRVCVCVCVCVCVPC